MGLIKEFREFIAKGNAMDLAVGVIIGAAFGKIVSSLVDDVITPALLTPALKAANLEKIQELKTDGGILYGNFLAAVLSFLIISFVIFLFLQIYLFCHLHIIGENGVGKAFELFCRITYIETVWKFFFYRSLIQQVLFDQ